MEKLLNIWKMRDLTLIGKITVIKSLAKLIHAASVLELSESFAHKVNSLIFKFIWNDKPPKIKKATLIGEKQDGGLKAPDFTAFDKALKLIWIKRFLDESDADRKLIPMETFDRYGGKLLLQSRHSIKLLSLDNLPSFYTKMLQFWQEIRNNERTEIDATNIVKEVIWNNRRIQINQKTVFFEKWYTKGILKIGDVIDENNNFLSFESLKRKYAIDINFVNYYGIISAIPRQWKQALKQTRNETCNQSKAWYEDPSSFTTQKIY